MSFVTGITLHELRGGTLLSRSSAQIACRWLNR